MAAGRKRKAPHLRVVDERADRDTGARPATAVKASAIKPPKSWKLSRTAAARFRELVAEMDEALIASPTYRRMLAMIVRVEEDVVRMREQIGEDWIVTVTSTQGEPVDRAHPLVASLQGAERHLASLYAACGLTPADISKAPRTKGGGQQPEGNAFLARSTRTTK